MVDESTATDFSEAAPVITAVTDSASVSVANAGTTTNALSTVSGTGNAGDTIYLYDNTSTNLVGTTTVTGSGTWSITGLASNTGVGSGSNTFSAKQVDALGNESVLSNLWTVNAPGFNTLSNGDFSAGNTGFTTTATLVGVVSAGYLNNSNGYEVTSNMGSIASAPTTQSLANQTTSNGNLTWSKTFNGTTVQSQIDATKAQVNPDGAITGNFLTGSFISSATIWKQSVSVTAGKTYTFKFDYLSGNFTTEKMSATIDGVKIIFVTNTWENGHFVANYVATESKTFDITLQGNNTAQGTSGGDFFLDNFLFAEATSANTLTAGSAALATPNADTALTYTAGSIDGLAGNDTITATHSALQTALAAGGFIDGGAGVDTLKLAAGTTLDLTAITGNQTVKPIQEVEVFEMQGNSALTLSANDVLSLGGSNASTMIGYTFASTTGGSASASSTGKVQMVINGTSSDALTLKTLAQDGVTTNGAQGNTGLAGEWTDMGTTVISGTTYRVYNHSTTEAQVLSTVSTSTESAVVAFTSMTKDSGPSGATADWMTADGSAGRLVSGTVATPLAAGDVVKVYANGTLLGNATVNAAGTAWEYTDTSAYNADWAYRADVVSSSGTIATAVQQVKMVTEPTITSVLVDTFTTSNTTDNFSSYTAGSTTGPNFTITARDGGTAGYGGSGATFNNVNDLLGGGMAIQFGNPQNQNANAVGEILITKKTGSMYSISFLYGDLQFGAKTVKLYAADGSVVNTFSIANGGATFNSGIQSQAFTSIGISGGRQDFWIMDNFNYAVATAAAGSGVSLAANSAFLDTSPTLQGTTGRALLPGETIRIFDGSTDLGEASVTGTNWTFNTTLPAGTSKTYTASIVSATGQVLQSSTGFTATQSASAPLVPTSNLPTATADTVTYSGSSLNALGGNDVITTGTDVQAKLAAGGFIDGGAGIDTLKLAAGTTLNLVTLTSNQTVKSIQQIESFELQGTSTLTLSANDVLSLGATDAFSGTAGKVQLLIKGTATDNVSLQNLLSDGAGGNTGLAGMWAKEASTATVGGLTYNVYSHSTTGAQVLISAAIPDGNVSLAASPLALDLNGDGVQTLNIDEGVLFDLMNTGTAQNVGWLDRNDGWLVMDLNQDGMVNTGAELLGTSTKLADGSLARDGWQALAQYDLNTDGVIDAQDAAFADLKVWVDADSDGVSDAGELKTLANAGVRSINLAHDAVETAQNGNVLQGFSSFTTSDGQSHQIVDAWVQTSAPAAGAATFNLVNAKADTLNLSLTDVLKTAANTDGQHVVQVRGDAGDTVNLSNLLDMGAAQGNWQASGAVVQGGVTYNAYSHSADASLQVLIDQHITQVHAA